MFSQILKGKPSATCGMNMEGEGKSQECPLDLKLKPGMGGCMNARAEKGHLP